MLAESAIKNKIFTFIKDYFIKESGMEVEDDTSFLDKGILDSTGVMELVAFIETAFEVRVEDEEIIPDNFDSLNKLVNFIRMKFENKSPLVG